MLLAETGIREIKSLLSSLLDQDVSGVEGLGGGRNNRVFKIECGASPSFIAKFYSHIKPSDRDNLDAEFAGLTFMWDNGVRCVPRPIAVDPDRRCAVYEYLEGSEITPDQVTQADIDQVVGFETILRDLRRLEGSADLAPASDFSFSVQGNIDGIDARYQRLWAADDGSSQYTALKRFLETDISPFLAEIRSRCTSALERSQGSLPDDLAIGKRTLSPSDFGFHNALRKPDGQIAFLDFEYFGWDDPAKMISDFLLHPGMRLDQPMKARFLAGSLDCFAGVPGLPQRVDLIYPLCGIKWCLLLLNEFLPAYLERRTFAKGEPVDHQRLQLQQLERATEMLETIKDNHVPAH